MMDGNADILWLVCWWTRLLFQQLDDVPEPVTLDFLDAEVEDANNEEVSGYILKV